MQLTVTNRSRAWPKARRKQHGWRESENGCLHTWTLERKTWYLRSKWHWEEAKRIRSDRCDRVRWSFEWMNMNSNFRQWFRKNGCNTICGFEGTCLFIFLDSSMVEHSAVNRRVVGSSPTRGAENPVWNQYWIFLYKYLQILVRYDSIYCAAKRAGQFCSYFKQADEMYGSMVKRLRHRPFTAVTGVQIPLESLRKLNKMAIWCGFTLTFGV